MGDIVDIKRTIMTKDRHLLVIIMLRYLDRTFFKDRNRAIAWIDCPNPNLGQLSPRVLIMSGKADKVWQFIESREYDRGDF